MKTKLWLFLISFALVFSACEKDAEFSDTFSGGGRDIAHLGDNYVFTVDADGVTETMLIAGQNDTVGTVKVKLTESEIIVTYYTDPGWFLTETHLHIAKNEEILFAQVTNRGGNPRIGNFDYGAEDISKTSWEIEIPKENISPQPEDWDGCYVIAAHAVVTGVSEEGGYFDLNAFALSLPETATIQVTWPDFANNPDAVSYFPNVSLTEADFLNGDFPGWCIQADLNIMEEEYDASVYSYNEEVPGYNAEFLKKVNWIINQKFVEDFGYTYADVQIAIWLLRHDIDIFTNDEWTDALRAIGSTALSRTYVGRLNQGYFEDNIKDILVRAAANYEDFVPACDDVIAIVFITPFGIQDIIVEYPVPCVPVGDGSETAWGQGCLFTERGSWAMYFKVCP